MESQSLIRLIAHWHIRSWWISWPMGYNHDRVHCNPWVSLLISE